MIDVIRQHRANVLFPYAKESVSGAWLERLAPAAEQRDRMSIGLWSYCPRRGRWSRLPPGPTSCVSGTPIRFVAERPYRHRQQWRVSGHERGCERANS